MGNRMDPERWKQVDRLLHQVLKRPVEEREAFLQHACGNDSALIDEVRSLLDSQQRAGSFMESPAIEVAAEFLAEDERFSNPQNPELESGAMIAHYRVLEKIGVGGMGEVYRARDTKLQRDVALKILPETMASDTQRMARFEREAQVLASLNHPNIAAIHGLEESNGIRALVMELVEGNTLAERISVAAVSSPPARSGEFTSPDGGVKPPLQIDDALPIARQIAEALEYAHERGVIHRDLKPANVKITPEGTVKVLDFGLAKVMNPQDSSATMDIANSPALSDMATKAGLILGTASYMSPEQAKGQRVDRRCDIWAFGCVLFEMLTGRKPFEGETISDVLAAVIHAEPDWDVLPASTPPSIQHLIHRCLQKDQRQRLQAIGDARIAIEEELSGTVVPLVEAHGQDAQAKTGAPVSPLRRALLWAIASLVAGALISGLVVFKFAFRAPQPQPLMRFTVAPPENATQFAEAGLSISPDGGTLAFTASPAPDKPRVLWVRPLDSLTAQQIPGTEGARLPFWSPDGQYIGFFDHLKLEKVAISGGPPQVLCTSLEGWGGTWDRDGVILFSMGWGLYRVPATGGAPTPVGAPDKAAPYFRYPQFLPDGRHFLFMHLENLMGASSTVKVGNLDSKKTVPLLKGSSNVLYARPGYLFYEQRGNLVARGFDAGSLKFTGQAVPVAQNVYPDASQWGPFSVSQSGILAYREGGAGALDEMAWFNRRGQRIGTLGQPGIYADPAFSPDGSRLAVSSISPGGKTAAIWIYNLKSDSRSRLTLTPALNDRPVWSNDGSRIYFSSDRDGKAGIYQKPADGLGNTQQVFLSSRENTYLNTLSPDGRYAIFSVYQGHVERALPLTGNGKRFTYVSEAVKAELSPNGRYAAYVWYGKGEAPAEIYVQTFPKHLGTWQVSTAGGREPMWRSDGKELFYIGRNGEMMSVDVTTSSGKFQAGTPKPLFKTHLVPAEYWRSNYAVSRDGQRFLMMVPPGAEAKPSPVSIVVNWPALLKNAGQ
jgi:serine/threonine protein kinase/Tol biopolymer transport system component